MSAKHDEVALEELIQRVGQYLSYAEFKRENEDLAEIISQQVFYRICKGNTKEINIRQLKRSYLQKPTEEFERDLELRRRAVRAMLDFEVEQ